MDEMCDVWILRTGKWPLRETYNRLCTVREVIFSKIQMTTSLIEQVSLPNAYHTVRDADPAMPADRLRMKVSTGTSFCKLFEQIDFN